MDRDGDADSAVIGVSLVGNVHEAGTQVGGGELVKRKGEGSRWEEKEI
jgi:hypothetical protein